MTDRRSLEATGPSAPEPRPQQLRRELRRCGLRATGMRIAVLEALEDSREPMSSADLAGVLPREHERTTIFRTLLTLTRVRLIHRVDVGDRIWRYQRSAPETSQRTVANFVCTTCRAVQALTEVTLSVGMPAPPHALAAREIEIAMYGVCDACRRGA
jgi:Fur family transcriptional regulator, ferric uptake regulator